MKSLIPGKEIEIDMEAEEENKRAINRSFRSHFSSLHFQNVAEGGLNATGLSFWDPTTLPPVLLK
jgi:hypothetical protein